MTDFIVLVSDLEFKNIDLKARVVTLNPGDVLFVPHRWWHYVENIEPAISLNTWIPLVSNYINYNIYFS